MKLDLVDVFARGPLSGNPLAVVRGADALDADQMLALTRWLGFSETTFLLPPIDAGADYRVRIFYPAGELPFAGHPTLGSARAWLAAGGVPRQAGMVVQECGVGLVPVRVAGEQFAFRAPPLLRSDDLDAQERAAAVRLAGADAGTVIAAVHAVNGPQWQLLQLDSAAAVLAARPAATAPVPTDIGLIGAYPAGSAVQFEVRAFFADPAGRLVEDPVTGSLNAAAAQYLFATGQVESSYVATQGQQTGADGLVQVARDSDGIWVGGSTRLVVRDGDLALAANQY